MSRKRIFDQKPGTTVYQHVDPNAPDDLILEEVDDLTDLLAEAKRLSEETPGKEFRHAAVIPPFVLRKAMREGWINDPKAWKEWANDPDNKIFRTWPGKL